MRFQTSTDRIDGDFNTTKAACSVALRLVQLMHRLYIFQDMRNPASGCFNGIGLHRVKQHLLQKMVLGRGFLPATSSARFRDRRYFAILATAPRLRGQIPTRRPLAGW